MPHRTLARLRSLVFVVLLLLSVGANASTLFPDPTFQVRARVLRIGEQAPAPTQQFGMSFGRVSPSKVAFAGDNWSDWLTFDAALYTKVRDQWPNDLMRSFMSVVLEFQGLEKASVETPAIIEVELKFDYNGAVHPLPARLYGLLHAIVLWQNGTEQQRQLAAQTEADFNRRFWKILDEQKLALAPEERPKQFPIIDGFRTRGNDITAIREGAENLPRTGVNIIAPTPPSTLMREELAKAGITRVTGAVNHPPGWVHDWSLQDPAAELKKWADKEAAKYSAAGYKPEDMTWYSFSDEPGFYVPKAFEDIAKSPAAIARFHQYLRDQKLSPQDVGAQSWEEVKPLGASGATSLPGKRLFYWTMRFISWDSGRYFSEATKVLENVFTPNLPIATNWNNFQGRFYTPGPIFRSGNSPDAAMLVHDWFEFAKQRGGTMLWTEDWFGGEYDPQWSYYVARLASAARQNNLTFGGYIIPRVSQENIGQKVLFLAGSGAKTIQYFTFGPEPTFPSNTYSFNADKVWPGMTRAHRMIAKAEDVLWPGQRPRAEAAVLFPTSAQLWDGKGIVDVTNAYAHRNITDYMGEMYGTYRTFQRGNVPLDFVSEIDLSPEVLRPYKLLYVTTPNLDRAQVEVLAQWVEAGGVLVTTPGAFQADRYNEATTAMRDLFGIEATEYSRRVLSHAFQDKTTNNVQGANGVTVALGPRTAILHYKGKILGTFDDGSPAAIEQQIGKGRHFHFAFFPALGNKTWGDGGSPWMMLAPRAASLAPPVTFDGAHAWQQIEAPLLLTKDSAAVTFINWLNFPAENLRVAVRLPFEATRVESVTHGVLKFEKTADGVSFALPLGDMDVVKIR